MTDTPTDSTPPTAPDVVASAGLAQKARAITSRFASPDGSLLNAMADAIDTLAGEVERLTSFKRDLDARVAFEEAADNEPDRAPRDQTLVEAAEKLKGVWHKWSIARVIAAEMRALSAMTARAAAYREACARAHYRMFDPLDRSVDWTATEPSERTKQIHRAAADAAVRAMATLFVKETPDEG